VAGFRFARKTPLFGAPLHSPLDQETVGVWGLGFGVRCSGFGVRCANENKGAQVWVWFQFGCEVLEWRVQCLRMEEARVQGSQCA
jgi:hypothetical protein